MQKKTRKIFFLILIILFLIATPSIIFYSWGYRFDLEAKKIVKTGAFYFKIVPKGSKVSIYPIEKGKINKEKSFSKKTNFFFRAIFIENLLPKKYEVEITKENFHPWKKTLEIKENQVVEAKNIILFPKEINFNLALKNIEDFFPSPDEKNIILKQQNTTNSPATSSDNNFNEWELKIFDTESHIISNLIAKKDISEKEKVEILDLKFSSDSQKILLKTEVKDNIKYFLINLTDNPKVKSLDFLPKETKDVFFHPNDNQKLLFYEKDSLWEVDLAQEKANPKELLKEIFPLETINKNFYYFDKNGFLFKSDFSQKEKINNIPFEIKNDDQKLKINIFSGIPFIRDEKKLFYLNLKSGSFEFLFETNKEPKIAPDYKKIVYFSDYEIWVFSLMPEMIQPQKEIGQKSFIARFSEKIDKAFFFDNYHLIFNVGNKIKIAETDDRDVINIVDLIEFPSPKIFWRSDLKTLFILSERNFYIIKKIYPS